ncbi:unnamed protein product [Gordionus sp. m RMFG-2023]|uniref:homeobox protein Hox-A4-like n=1 Tax=Gordionus sp. m RMFG-2023 TaxID=3053472 RepID=UPI0030E068B8
MRCNFSIENILRSGEKRDRDNTIKYNDPFQSYWINSRYDNIPPSGFSASYFYPYEILQNYNYLVFYYNNNISKNDFGKDFKFSVKSRGSMENISVKSIENPIKCTNNSRVSLVSIESSCASKDNLTISKEMVGSKCLKLDIYEKCKKNRQAYNPQQLQNLEMEFKKERYLTVNKRKQMSIMLKLSENQIKTWFQNRRTKWKKQMTAYMKRKSRKN